MCSRNDHPPYEETTVTETVDEINSALEAADALLDEVMLVDTDSDEVTAALDRAENTIRTAINELKRARGFARLEA